MYRTLRRVLLVTAGIGLLAAFAAPATDALARPNGRVEIVEVHERSQDSYSSSYNGWDGRFEESRLSSYEYDYSSYVSN